MTQVLVGTRLTELLWFADTMKLQEAHFDGKPVPEKPTIGGRALEDAAGASRTQKGGRTTIAC
ncbi:hypothetical protein [Acidovorax cavernicola]|uniref:Uncharacterized protein n=1 Tax=Acidovorax cavernicola TaxID=1675792 RepID=A0A9X8D890_9BURK|nr:hypothetical protein [Acidovorax cavernicola]RIX83215.1 hypothetical protein D3H34_07205 [Acidovorax cavernicola]